MRSFTTSYKKISRVLSNEVTITKAVSPSNSRHLSLKGRKCFSGETNNLEPL